MAATATKHRLQPGETCGHCDLRAPPVHKCSYCTRPVKDWPQDEVTFLTKAGWEWLEPAGQWREPERNVLGPITPAMLQAAQSQVVSYEMQLAKPKLDPFHKEQLTTGLAKAKAKLERLESGEPVEHRNRELFGRDTAVMLELGRGRPHDPRPKVVEIRTFTDATVDQMEQQLRSLHNGTLLKSDEAQLRARRKQMSKVHHQMCPECRQF